MDSVDGQDILSLGLG